MELEKYFLAATQSVGTAATLAGAGVYFHRRVCLTTEGGWMMMEDGKKLLALISQQITIPAFLLTKIVQCPSSAAEGCPSLLEYWENVWMVLLFPIYVVTCGLIVGRIAAMVSQTPKRHYPTSMAACAFANSTGLPMTLLTVVHHHSSNTNPNPWNGSDIGQNDPTLFLSMYLLLYPILQWGIGGCLLAARPKHHHHDNHHHDTSSQIRLSTTTTNTTNTYEDYEKQSDSDSSHDDEGDAFMEDAVQEQHCLITTPASASVERRCSVIHNHHPEDTIQLQEIIHPENLISHSNNNTDDLSSTSSSSSFLYTKMSLFLPLLRISSSSSSNLTTTISGSTSIVPSSIQTILRNAFQPPVIAVLIGIFVSCIPNLRGLFVNNNNYTTTTDDQQDPPLFEWFFRGLYLIGQAAVPMNMIILGINLSKTFSSSPSKSSTPTTNTSTASTTTNSRKQLLLPKRTMIAIIIGKMIVMPIIGFMTCILLKNYILDIPDEIDGTIYLVLMMVFITPTANNVMVMVELSGCASKEGMARLIGWQYVVAPLILSINVAILVSIASQW